MGSSRDDHHFDVSSQLVTTSVGTVDPPSSGRGRVVEVLAWLTGLAIVLPLEVQRVQALWSATHSLSSALFHWNVDTTLPALLLLAAPFVWAFAPTRPAALPSGSSPGVVSRWRIL